MFVPEQPESEHRFATASRANLLAITYGAQRVRGRFALPLSYDEAVEPALLGIQGGVTPSAGIWTFTPGANLPDSATMEWQDGARAWQIAGVYADTLRIQGSAGGPNMLSGDLFGKAQIIQALTGSLVARTPTILLGRQSRLYLDAFGGTPGSTQIAGTLVNWNYEFRNGIAPHFFADNVNAVGALTIDQLAVTCQLVINATQAQAATEFANWVAGIKRLARLRFGDDTNYVDVDMAGAWTAFDLGQADGNLRTYGLRMTGIYDPTNSLTTRWKIKNGRSAAW